MSPDSIIHCQNNAAICAPPLRHGLRHSTVPSHLTFASSIRMGYAEQKSRAKAWLRLRRRMKGFHARRCPRLPARLRPAETPRPVLGMPV